MSDEKTTYTQKAWTATPEALQELKEISRAIGIDDNASATVRYCIKQVYNRIKKEQAS